MSVRTERCETCSFFELTISGSITGYASGECRRRAPIVGPVGATFPGIYGDRWCGEYMPKDLPPMPPGGLEVREDQLAAAAADVAQFIKDRIALCGHGLISVTCGPCMAPWVPR